MSEIRDVPKPKAAFFDDMTWPKADEYLDNLDWRMRYNPNSLSREDLLWAAFILSAYKGLIFNTQKQRNHICNRIKEPSK